MTSPRRLRHLPAHFVRLACVLALVVVAFAHRPGLLPPGVMPAEQLAAYVLPDGTLPDLCLPETGGKGAFKAKPCEFCRTAGSALLPEPPVVAAALGLVPALPGSIRDRHAAPAAPGFPAAPPRGPPLNA